MTVEIDATGWVFEPGHRIGLSIAGADYPNQWPTPQPATIEVLCGGGHSRLTLPVVPARGSAPPTAFAPSPTTVGLVSAAVQPPVWQHLVDVLTGRESVRVAWAGRSRALDGGIAGRDYELVTEVDPTDPAHASVRAHWEIEFGRPGLDVRSIASTTILSTATDFHVTMDLEVRVNGAAHAQRRWTESFPRRL